MPQKKKRPKSRIKRRPDRADAITQFVRQLVRKFPNEPNRTLARRVVNEFGEDILTIEQARARVRYVVGQKGKLVRQHADVKKKAGKAGWKPTAPPPTQAKEWVPFEIPGKSIGIISDCHIPYHCDAFEFAVNHLKKRHKIDTLVINGDFGDWYSISRWQKDPTKRDLLNEVQMQLQGLEYLRGEFPKAEIIFKIGNHEERWAHYIWNNAPLFANLPNVQLESVLEFDRLGIQMVGGKTCMLAGKLPIMHGHELPKGLTNPVNMARGAFLRAGHPILVGHGHRTSGHAEPNMFHEELFCWSIGCLCNLNPDFAVINKWNHGFAHTQVATNRDYDVSNYRITADGQIRSS